MSEETCILTTKDLTILEVMLDRCLGGDDPMAPLLRWKIDAAQVVFRDDVPANVATLNSRVSFRVDGKDPDTRIISHEKMASPVGLFLPITSARGLALLGLAEGQVFHLPSPDGVGEQVRLEEVLYQPEAARREKDAMAGLAQPKGEKSTLRVIGGTCHEARGTEPVGPGGFDDPGPTAA